MTSPGVDTEFKNSVTAEPTLPPAGVPPEGKALTAAQVEEGKKQALAKKINDLKAFYRQNFFKDESWEFDESAGDKKLVFSNLSDKSQKVYIEFLKDGKVKFSASSPPDLALAAMHYLDSEKESQRDVKFTVEAESVEDAKAFIRALAVSGFNIATITELSLDLNEPYDINELKADILQEMEPPRKSASPSPAPYPSSSGGGT